MLKRQDSDGNTLVRASSLEEALEASEPLVLGTSGSRIQTAVSVPEGTHIAIRLNDRVTVIRKINEHPSEGESRMGSGKWFLSSEQCNISNWRPA